jgi:hypothetical protein
VSEITIDKIYNIKLTENELFMLAYYIHNNNGYCDNEKINKFVKELASDIDVARCKV